MMYIVHHETLRKLWHHHQGEKIRKFAEGFFRNHNHNLLFVKLPFSLYIFKFLS